jgi:Tellurite resistance protein TerB
MSEVTAKELHRILRFRFRLDDSSAAQLIEDAHAAERSAIDLYQFTRQLNEAADENSRQQVVQMMWETPIDPDADDEPSNPPAAAGGQCNQLLDRTSGPSESALCIADWLSALLREHETFESRPRLCHRCGAAKWIIADALEGDLAISGLATFGYREGWQRIVSCGLDDLVGR